MRCGRLWGIKATSSGFGSLWMSTLVRLLEFMWAIAPGREPRTFGILGRVSTVNARKPYTDFWDAYALVFPQKRHKAVGK